LLDEPGLHLHPQAQRDLLARLQDYAVGNTLIYTTHLPFMIDLHRPECIRVLANSADDGGAVVSNDLTNASPEAKLVLRTALEIGGGTSYLLAEDNLVVEGVHDYWLLTALSNLLRRNGKPGLPESLMITAAGGAPEVTYISTIVVGQELRAIALYDTDQEGLAAKDNFLKKWLTKYKGDYGHALSLGSIVEPDAKEFAIEDMFEEEFYLKHVEQVYRAQLDAVGAKLRPLPAGNQLGKRVDAVFTAAGLKFNKGSVAKVLQKTLNSAKTLGDIPEVTIHRSQRLFAEVQKIVDQPATKPAVESR
jgi:predicted ATP-dependent endonuclease of OLD family